MKKLFWFLIFNLVLLLLLIAQPSIVLGVTWGDPCTQVDALSDCQFRPAGSTELKTGCCVCDGKIWDLINDTSPCSVLFPGRAAFPGAGEEIINPVLKRFGVGEGAEILAQMIASFLKIAFSLAGLILLAMLLAGGVQWMTAGGDKEKISRAQGRISSALIGFAIFMSVFVIINFIAPVLGLEFLQILKIEWPVP